MKIKRIGVDLAKNVYQLHGVDRHDKCVLKRRLKRDDSYRFKHSTHNQERKTISERKTTG